MFIERFLKNKLISSFEKFPVLFLTGARQSGKTSLVKNTFPNLNYFNLGNSSLSSSIIEDPHGFLSQHKEGIILDEVQNFPELFSYIQIYVDERNKNGQWGKIKLKSLLNKDFEVNSMKNGYYNLEFLNFIKNKYENKLNNWVSLNSFSRILTCLLILYKNTILDLIMVYFLPTKNPFFFYPLF